MTDDPTMAEMDEMTEKLRICLAHAREMAAKVAKDSNGNRGALDYLLLWTGGDFYQFVLRQGVVHREYPNLPSADMVALMISTFLDALAVPETEVRH
ncbi:MAG: hypothetical protein J0I48_05290 [Devosia sp.]|uniref:hypothetical protein n=1 Tax=Devosia sp. 66-22 TaxID=1895753 RepID=UPI000928B4F4|nr:hypothetical protein [Devosia sp. 66-22]MBN9345607.1 hypothetical protein [Devosia sp.]OJX50693.1 MAG: hypothetical protein BGO81_20815 [Devosia sp. 66-22]